MVVTPALLLLKKDSLTFSVKTALAGAGKSTLKGAKVSQCVPVVERVVVAEMNLRILP
jgi:hypothetical protein